MILLTHITRDLFQSYTNDFWNCLKHNSLNNNIKKIIVFSDIKIQNTFGVEKVTFLFRQNLDQKVIYDYQTSPVIIKSDPFVRFYQDLKNISESELREFVLVGDGFEVFSNITKKMIIEGRHKIKNSKLYTQRKKVISLKKSDSKKIEILTQESTISSEKVNPKLDVIIISVNYNDCLIITLPKNLEVFENITVITTPEDEMCQKICKKFGVRYITTNVMYELGAKFNKGKAVDFAIKMLNDPGYVLLLDADMIINRKIDTSLLKRDVLYTTDRVIIEDLDKYKVYLDNTKHFLKNQTVNVDERGIGFFQLFHMSSECINRELIYPTDSDDASWTDLKFRDKFSKRENLELEAIHLGPAYTNWSGRNSEKFLPESELLELLNKKSTYTICSFYFNYNNDWRQKRNFIKFLEQWKDYYGNMIVGIVDYGDIDFEIPCEKIIIEGDVNKRIWSKEILINKTVEKIDTDYILWVDGDIIYEDLSWLNNLDRVIGDNDFVQLFEKINYLDEWGEITNVYKSIATSGLGDVDQLMSNGCRPGGAWLSRTSTLKLKPLFDEMSVGGGDTILAYAMFGNLSGRTLNKVKESNKSIYNRAIDWISKFGTKKISYLPESVNHLYHGDIIDRKYDERYVQLKTEIIEEDNKDLISEKVLVIIPAYNSEKTIIQSINSILNQSHNNVEVVVVDDFSQDQTSNLVLEHQIKHNRLFLISMNDNVGTYQAINTALCEYNGFDYFTIHGSDDQMVENKIEKHLQIIKTEKTLASISGYDRVDISNENIISSRELGESMVVYKRKVFDDIGYYDNTRFAGDSEYLERFKKKFGEENLSKIYQKLSRCYITGKNLTIDIVPLGSQSRIDYCRRYISDINKMSIDGDFYRSLKKEKIKKRLFFVCKDNAEHFALPYLRNINEYEVVKVCLNDKNILLTSNKNDIIWYEWANDYTIKMLERYKAKNVVRIHDWEIYYGMIDKFNWNLVDIAWFINRNSMKDFKNRIPENSRKSLTYLFLPNSVEMESSIKEKFNFNIVSYSVSFKERKNYERLISIFSKIHSVSDKWKLFIRAGVVDAETQENYQKCLKKINDLDLTNHVTIIQPEFDIKKINDKSDIIEFLDNKSVIISSSSHEAFHYAIAEGMSRGLKPIVFDWEWGNASDFWEPFLFKDEDSIVEELVKWSKKSKQEKKELSSKYVSYIENQFHPALLSKKLVNKFNKKKLCMILHHHPFKWNPRGAEKSMMTLINKFRDDYEIIVVTHNIKNNIEESETVDDVRYYTIPSDSRFVSKLSKVLKLESPDICLTYENAAVNSYQTLYKLNIPYILMVRWFRHVLPLPPGDLMKREIDYNFVNKYKNMYEYSKSIITNNNYSCDIIERIYNKKAVCSYVPVYIENKENLANRKGKILLVTPDKDLGEIDFINNISKILKDEKFLIINSKKLDIFSDSKNVEVRGYVSDMRTVFSETKITIYVAYRNDVCGTSRILTESMAYGIPGLCNARSGLNEKTPFFVSKDANIDEWVEKIEWINQNYDFCNNLSIKTYDEYDNEYQIDVFKKEIEK
jgi:glycosyltransferase involved in cell wall biosynthesis